MGALTVALLSVMLGSGFAAAPASRPADEDASRSSRSVLPNPFFAMDTATKDEQHQTIESQVRMVKELGFAGWGPAYGENLPDVLKAVDKAGLDLSALYVAVIIDAASPKFPPSLAGHIERLRGRGTILWAVVRSEKRAGQSEEMDRAAVSALRELAAVAEEGGIRVAVYPHVGDYIARTRDALRIVRAVDRPNVGLSFNLCHWLRTENGSDLEELLSESMPHLFVVTINGADRKDPDFKNWSRYIQPLGQGDFDVYGLMKTLRRLGFTGPVGLQGYGLKGSMEEHLRAAMNTWREYAKRMASSEPGSVSPVKP